MTHTPGPWKILRHDLGDEEIFVVPVEILAGNGKLVVAYEGGLAPINQEWTCEEIEGNGALIEAAPNMLAVLEKLSSLLVDGEEYVPLELREELTTVIQKARGDRMTNTTEKWYVGYDQEYDVDAGDDGRTIGYPTGRDEFNGTVFRVTGADKTETIAEHIRDEKTAHQIKAVPDMILALNDIIEHCEYEGYPSSGEILRIAKHALKEVQ